VLDIAMYTHTDTYTHTHTHTQTHALISIHTDIPWIHKLATSHKYTIIHNFYKAEYY